MLGEGVLGMLGEGVLGMLGEGVLAMIGKTPGSHPAVDPSHPAIFHYPSHPVIDPPILLSTPPV